MGFQKDPYNPLRDINKVIQGLKEEKDADRYILLIDEVLPTKENETCDKLYLSYLDLSCSHIDILLALNPMSLPFKTLKNGFKVIPSKDPNTLSKQLYIRHRNNYTTAVFVDHWLPFSIHGILDSSNDLPLNPDNLPPGRLPLWIQRGVNVSDQDVLDFIKTKHVLEHETVTLLYSSHQKQEIDQICKQNGWRSMQESHILGSEDQVVIIFDMGADPEHVSRAKNALILVTTQG